MFKVMLVALFALGLVTSGGATGTATQTGTPEITPVMAGTGVDSELANTYANEYATKFTNEFANKGEDSGPFLTRFAQMFERSMGWDLNVLPDTANVDARTPDRIRKFAGMEFPVTTGPLAKKK
jgi:hypothetical protein